MSAIVDKLKKQLEKELEKEVSARVQPILDVMKQVLDELKTANRYLKEILEAIRSGKEKRGV